MAEEYVQITISKKDLMRLFNAVNEMVPYYILWCEVPARLTPPETRELYNEAVQKVVEVFRSIEPEVK